MKFNNKKIVVIGLWHQGIVASACFADWGYDVFSIDKNEDKINSLNNGVSPIYEPGLDSLIKSKHKEKKLIFSTQITRDISSAGMIMIAHDTPIDDQDISDASEVFSVIDEISPLLTDGVLIHVTSQLKAGSCREIIEKIKKNRPNLSFFVTYSPENLRLGEAIDRFKSPRLPVVGGENDESFRIFEDYFVNSKVIWHHCDLLTAEVTKHALNAYLATSITFANELGSICDEINANAHQVAKFLKLEPRIGPNAILTPGLGFSGGTLARDIQTLRSFGRDYKFETKLFDAVWEINRNQKKLLINKIMTLFEGNIKGKIISVLGLTYKAGTSTLRRSFSIEIVQILLLEGAYINATDPLANEKEFCFFKCLSNKNFKFSRNMEECVNDSDMILLMTPWPEFKEINFSNFKKNVRKHFVFDTANILDAEMIKKSGFHYINIGGGNLYGK